jgi:hypothetical protein
MSYVRAAKELPRLSGEINAQIVGRDDTDVEKRGKVSHERDSRGVEITEKLSQLD